MALVCPFVAGHGVLAFAASPRPRPRALFLELWTYGSPTISLSAPRHGDTRRYPLCSACKLYLTVPGRQIRDPPLPPPSRSDSQESIHTRTSHAHQASHRARQDIHRLIDAVSRPASAISLFTHTSIDRLSTSQLSVSSGVSSADTRTTKQHLATRNSHHISPVSSIASQHHVSLLLVWPPFLRTAIQGGRMQFAPTVVCRPARRRPVCVCLHVGCAGGDRIMVTCASGTIGRSARGERRECLGRGGVLILHHGA
jgi:hypothetical protein